MQIVNQIIRISKGYYVNVADLEAVMPLQAESKSPDGQSVRNLQRMTAGEIKRNLSPQT